MELNRETVINQMQEWSDGICKNACLKGEYLNGKIVACETCFPNTVRNALALIKELTEDNEYLKTQLTATEARAESRKESDLEEVLGLRLRVEELTEESKKWEQAYDCMHSACRELSSKCDRLTEENERLVRANSAINNAVLAVDRMAKADTVRKMQERLDKHFCHDPAFLGVEQRLIMGVIDQIAKEMLEGSNEQ